MGCGNVPCFRKTEVSKRTPSSGELETGVAFLKIFLSEPGFGETREKEDSWREPLERGSGCDQYLKEDPNLRVPGERAATSAVLKDPSTGTISSTDGGTGMLSPPPEATSPTKGSGTLLS